MKTIKILSIALVAVVLFSCNKNGVTNKPLNTEIDSVSYAIGLNTGIQIRTSFDEADVDLFIQGLRNGVDSTNILIEENNVNGVIQKFFSKKQREAQEKQQAEHLKKIEEQFNDNKVAGENFLEENKAKAGVITTASGLQYIVLKEGTGEKPEGPTTKVKVHYHGTNLDGEVFDSSVEKGTPYETALNRVIPGWTEGVQLMSVGSKYKFFIPQELAYGARQSGAKIKPFSALIFEVELLDIIK